MSRPATAEDRDTLRFVTCGSVDDGKSTLIGRLLYDARKIPDDDLAALAATSQKAGARQGLLDFALLVDGLETEREQGITIDVAYRFFSTANRQFIVADAPGHEHYTRNMVTGASTADAAVILVDASKGVTTQTHRHSYLVHLLGIRRLILAVNKMDLVGGDQGRFMAIVADYERFAQVVGIDSVVAVPMVAVDGDNLWIRGRSMPWYSGPTLIEALEQIPVDHGAETAPFRFFVQLANRPDASFRGVSGMVAQGSVTPGDAVRVLPGDRLAQVDRLVTADGDRTQAIAGQSVTLTFATPVDCARGDLIAAADDPADVADRFQAMLVWMAEEPLLPGRTYWMKLGTQLVPARVQPPRYLVNVDTLEQLAGMTLELNAIGLVEVATDRQIAFAPYDENRTLGGFVLIDRENNATVAAGLIRFALRRSHALHWQAIEVDRGHRAKLKEQRPHVLWLTGVSGAGKSTIANVIDRKLALAGRHTFLLDGDNLRHGLNQDLGFTDADRIENIRRAGEVARLMADAGLIVIAAFISPFRAEREMVRAMMAPDEFAEIFVDTPLAEAEARDVKGLYAKARRGELRNFTGIDSAYEAPDAPDVRIDTTRTTAEEAADLVIARLRL